MSKRIDGNRGPGDRYESISEKRQQSGEGPVPPVDRSGRVDTNDETRANVFWQKYDAGELLFLARRLVNSDIETRVFMQQCLSDEELRRIAPFIPQAMQGAMEAKGDELRTLTTSDPLRQVVSLVADVAHQVEKIVGWKAIAQQRRSDDAAANGGVDELA